MSAESTTELRFDPPGPGFWEQDAVHLPRPVTRYWAEMHPEPFKRGFQELTAYYGLLLDTIDYRYINGFAYKTAVPVQDSEVPARFARAEEAIAGKLWRDQLRDWDSTFKPQSIAKHRELQSIDIDALSDEELVEYLGRCRDHHMEMIYQHMRHTGAAVIPTGDFLAHVGDWTGLGLAELLGLMRGASPVSSGASDELERLIAAVKADPAARALLDSDGDPGETLEQLRSLDGEAGEAAAGYLDLVGYRLLDGFDISGRYALEMPETLLRAIRIAVDEGGREEGDVEAQIAEVRAKVPDDNRAEFDDLLGEARLTYRLRDERGVFSDIWASGIMRRAAIGAGRRLAEKGRIQDPEHFVDADFGEMKDLVLGTGGPSAEELAERAAYRANVTNKDVPATLGTPPPPPPDPSGLPPAEGRIMRAVGIAVGEIFGSSQAENEERLVRGLAASAGVFEGVARRIAGPTEFDRIVQGDVLVTESTTEAFNILLPLLGAIVTDAGGLLSHAAIVSREYGIPGVVGTREATELIPDGARVRVDGNAGEVTVL
jgi:phosphohistidine swiveling domain-containing protein